MPRTIDFIFDFASPNAYFVYQALPDFLARTGAQVNYKLCLLGGIFKATNNQAPMLAFGNIQNKLEYENLEIERFIKKHNITKFKMNPHFPVNTVSLIRGALGAEEDGYLPDYIGAMLGALWEQGLKLDDRQVLQQAWNDAGFDAARLAEQIQNDAIKKRLIDNTAEAVARGAFGIPTFFIGDDMFFGKERLDQMEDYLTQS